MYRGTTPSIVLKVNSDLDLAEMSEIWVTFKNKSAEITYTLEQIEVNAEEHTIGITMSQEDTLSFQTCGAIGGKIEIQARFLDEGGLAYASNIASIELSRILKEGVIE